MFNDPVTVASLADVGTHGQKFNQLYHHIPALERFYFDFEKNWRAEAYITFAKENQLLPYFLCVIYLIFIFGGREYFRQVDPKTGKERKGYDLKFWLASWNLALSLFSWCGAIRTVPHLLIAISNQSFKSTICTASEVQYGEGAAGFWVMLFIFSKVPELVDTVFITLRKKKLIFLHWYHHITVLCFCWHSYVHESSTGLYFVAMNYTVHAIMYGYFYFMAIGANPGQYFNPMYITLMQITQMIVGVAVCYSSYVYMNQGGECHVKKTNVIAGGLMYGSYLYLFAEFAVKRFFLTPKKSNKKKVT